MNQTKPRQPVTCHKVTKWPICVDVTLNTNQTKCSILKSIVLNVVKVCPLLTIVTWFRYTYMPCVSFVQILLPKGCCRTEYYSDTYILSYKYNFLGVQSSVEVPLNTSLCILIDVLNSPLEDDAVNNTCLPGDVSCVPDSRTLEERLSDGAMASESSASGPHSLLVRVGSAEEIVDLSMIHYRVLHAPKLLPSKGEIISSSSCTL